MASPAPASPGGRGRDGGDEAPPSPSTRRQSADNINSAELQSKFQRLLGEYAKIKNQNKILKAAVKQEQAKSKSLEMALKEKEVALRAAAEETDALQFNNERLTKRIEKMMQHQREEHTRSEGSGGWLSSFGGGGAKNELAAARREMGVIKQELSVKIEENERLHIQQYEKEKDWTAQKEQLQERVLAMKRTVKRSQDALEQAEVNHKEAIDALDGVKRDSEETISRLKFKLSRAQSNLDEARKHAKEEREKLNQAIDEYSQYIERKVPFDDTEFDELNQLNLPPARKETHVQIVEGAGNSVGVFEQLLTSLFEYHECQQKKLHMQCKNENVTPNVASNCKELGRLIHGYDKILKTTFRVAEEAVQSYGSSKVVSIQTQDAFRDCCRKIVNQNGRIVSRHLLWLQNHSSLASSRSPLCESMAEAYRRHHNCLEEVFSGITRIKSRLGFLCFKPLFLELIDAAKLLIEDENENPFALEVQKAINQRIINAFAGIKLFLGNLSNAIDQVVHVTSQPAEFPVRGALTSRFRIEGIEQRTRACLKTINSLMPSSGHTRISYYHADALLLRLTELKERCVLLRQALEEAEGSVAKGTEERRRLQAELAGAKDQVASKQSHFNKLLADVAATRQQLENLTASYRRQQQVLEATAREKTALQSRLDSLPSLAQDNPENLASPSGSEEDGAATPRGSVAGVDVLSGKMDTQSLLDAALPTAPPPEFDERFPDRKRYTMKVIDEEGQESESLGVDQQQRDRERELRHHYEVKLAQCTCQAKAADEKAMRYFSSHKKLAEELQQLKDDHQRYLSSTADSTRNLQEAKDDLDSTRRNYEQQLTMLTEHVVSLNQQISKQEEELSRLKSHRVHCKSCNGWNTGRNGRVCARGNHATGYNYV